MTLSHRDVKKFEIPSMRNQSVVKIHTLSRLVVAPGELRILQKIATNTIRHLDAETIGTDVVKRTLAMAQTDHAAPHEMIHTSVATEPMAGMPDAIVIAIAMLSSVTRDAMTGDETTDMTTNTTATTTDAEAASHETENMAASTWTTLSTKVKRPGKRLHLWQNHC